jgi:hypothetical protein
MSLFWCSVKMTSLGERDAFAGTRDVVETAALNHLRPSY